MAEQTLKEKTAKGLFWGGLSNGTQQVLNAIFGVFLARLLSPDDYGLIGMLGIFMGSVSKPRTSSPCQQCREMGTAFNRAMAASVSTPMAG